MDQLFDPDSPPAATEWERGTVFDRAASVIERLEQGYRKGGGEGMDRGVRSTAGQC